MFFLSSFSFLFLHIVSMISLTTTAFATTPSKKTVLISGAGGQTGQALFRQLLADHIKDSENFPWYPIGLVRSEERRNALLESGDIPASHVQICDVTDASQVKNAVEACPYPLGAFGICTSAKPAPTGETNPDTGRPVFSFPNGDPELVDWMGQKNQIDACPPGAHVILCSTMGGTNAEHPLNNLGRTLGPDGKTHQGGMIVQWKRKSEVYLTQQSSLQYTIVHPGGLINEPGGQRELVVGVDDGMEGTDSRTVPREDVASVMRAALLYPDTYAKRSFDLRAKEPKEADGACVETDWGHLLDGLNGNNCDYSLGATM